VRISSIVALAVLAESLLSTTGAFAAPDAVSGALPQSAVFQSSLLRFAVTPGPSPEVPSGLERSAAALQNSVRQAVHGHGRVEFDPSHGRIEVTAEPRTVSRVEGIVSEADKRTAAQVTVSLQVLSFSPRDRSSLMQAAHYLESAQSTHSAEQIVEQLSTLGDVKQRTMMTTTTPDGVATPLADVHTTHYTRTVAPTPAGPTGVETASLTTGTVLSFLPHLQSEGRVSLSFSLKESWLAGHGPDAPSVPEDSVQIPQVASLDFLRQASLKDGSTIALYGFATDKDGRPDKTGGPEGAGSYVALVTVKPLRLLLTPG
jgi:hypothetical protein